MICQIKSAAVVLDHRDDRALVDAEVIVRDPADILDDPAVLQRHVGEREARIHGVEKSIALIQVLAEARAECANASG